MVRRLWPFRLIAAAARRVGQLIRWLLRRAGRLLRLWRPRLVAAAQVARLFLRGRDPNNLFVSLTEAAHHSAEAPARLADVEPGERTTTLLWAGPSLPEPPEPAPARAALWRGLAPSHAQEALKGAEAANRRFAYVDLLQSPIRKLTPEQIRELEELLERLARKWLAHREAFREWPRRARLDVGRTLRHNLPRYGGAVLEFRWPVKVVPVPQPEKPSRILVIGDVSHSMARYVSVVLFFFHKLNFRFVVESYVFSESATYATPYLNGPGSFAEKAQRLMQGARSWNAGTRFGTALEEIAREARVDDQTYVFIATDGKVSLAPEEQEKIRVHMAALRRQARQVIFLTPSAEFAGARRGPARAWQRRLGTFYYGPHEVPVWLMGSPHWYGTLARYADRLYLIRTVQDLIDMVENLLMSSGDDERRTRRGTV